MTGPRILTGPGGFTWDPAALRYRGPGGRFVTQSAIRAAVDEAIRKNKQHVRELANQLRAGQVTLDTWYAEMRGAVKDANLYGAAAAKGGWAQLTPTDFGRVGAAVKVQYAYLDRFIGEIDDDLPLDGRFTNRAMSYLNSGRALYEDVREDVDRAGGFTEERNRLAFAEHCTGPGSCVEQSALGVVGIGELIPIGERLCRGNCLCRIERRKGPGFPWV